MTVERMNYPALGAPAGPYVHATKCNGLVFLSGLSAFGSPAQGRGIAEQAEAIFKQIRHVAEQEGTTLAALAKVTIFVSSTKDIGSLRKALIGIYGKHLPASSLVQVSRLFSPEIDIEIEAVLSLG